MWEDMKLYWAWRGKGFSDCEPPTIKRLDYVQINKGTATEMSLCIGVWDDEKYTPLNRDELEFHTKQYPCTKKSIWPQCNAWHILAKGNNKEGVVDQ